jgi:peptidoglycan/LPS O-acetylase OafA/YrhL
MNHPMHTPKGLAHEPALDAIRGLAILLVVAHHVIIFSELTPNSGAEKAVKVLAGRGWVGVDLFFVLSGFLITSILLGAKTKADYFRNFYGRRVLRILPLYYLFLAVILLVIPALWAVPATWRAALTDQGWYWLHLSNVKLFRAGGFISPMINHTWSLAIEEQFYLVWPFVVWKLPLKILRALLAVIIAGSALARYGLYLQGTDLFAIRVITPARLDTLGAGALLATYYAVADRRVLLRRWTGGSIVAAVLVLAAGALARDQRLWQSVFDYTFNAAVFSALIAAALMPAWRLGERLSGVALLRAFGRYSYGYYLWHQPIFFFAAAPLAALVFGATGSALAAWAVVAIVLIPACFAVAWVSFNGYEQRFLKLKRRFGSGPETAPPLLLR